MREMRKGVSCWDCGQWLCLEPARHTEKVTLCDECEGLRLIAEVQSPPGDAVLSEPHCTKRPQVNDSYPYVQLKFL